MRFLIFLILLISCSDHMVMKVDPKKADILVHPASIEFGHLESGLETDTSILNIINVGDEILYLDPPHLYENEERYTLDWVGVTELGPGEIIDIPITYIPETFESNEAYVEIYSSDEDEPLIIIPINGNGDAPIISVGPADVDYGDISIGCDNEERITISNSGNLPLLVESVTQMVTQPADILMEYGALPEPPWEILPNEELDFLVSYIPTDVGADSSQITVVSNDPMISIVDVLQYGDGDVEQWINDEFEQEEIPLLDVLWVIDNSGSMNVYQQFVATNMTDFMSIFLAASPDYHMAFITTDDASFVGNVYIDNATQDPELQAASLIGSIGTFGSAHEKGIKYAKESTSSVAYAGPGSDFLREDATLVLIFLSDEPDYSESGWASYITHFENLKDPNLLQMVSIVGDAPSGCTWTHPTSGQSRTIAYGEGYTELTNYFHGTLYSICAADWGLQMQSLANTVSVKREFQLSEADPIETTIEVYVNGQLVAGAWEYSAVDNLIKFYSGQEPIAGATITIEYATWGCD